ncbi:YopX family protein [Anaerococcus vaginalis]|uniref:YopX family protein n=1 Tax=Anaerococcus vaginalis TaxID=33037 RepID=UPI0022E44D89|nr:YopX family protein [Anaerococcus vaginalis]
MIPKFRAYFNKYKRMIYSIGVVNENTILVDFNGDGDLETIFLTNDISLMQSTGLKDKNGNEIYDGDVCRWTDSEAFDGEIISDVFIARYSDEYLKWIGENNNSYDDLYDFTDDRQLELIGNIYENPKLLDEVEE